MLGGGGRLFSDPAREFVFILLLLAAVHKNEKSIQPLVSVLDSGIFVRFLAGLVSLFSCDVVSVSFF